MKVLWVTNNPCSSIERNGGRTITGGWLSSLEKAVRNDIELEIAFLSSGQVQEDFAYNGVEYHSIAPFRSGSYIIFRLRRLLMPWSVYDRLILDRLECIIEKSRPDIIHIHGTEKCFGLIYGKMRGKDGCIEAGGKKIPVVISIQGVMELCLEKYFSGISMNDVLMLESIGCRLRKQSAIMMYRQLKHQARNEALMLKSARFILGRTDMDREFSGRMNPERLYFTVNEIMREPFYHTYDDMSGSKEIRDRDRREGCGQHIKIVSTISDGIYKGYELLLKTACTLKGRKVRYSWTVIGLSYDSEMVSIAEKSTGLASADLDIQLAGRMDASEMVREMSSADIYCQVSHIENSPNSLCEAMLLGLPSVATDVGGTSSIVDNGVTGLLVPDTDPDAYADAIIRLASDSEAADMAGKAARKAAAERHDPVTVRKQLIHTYEEIIETCIQDSGQPA